MSACRLSPRGRKPAFDAPPKIVQQGPPVRDGCRPLERRLMAASRGRLPSPLGPGSRAQSARVLQSSQQNEAKRPCKRSLNSEISISHPSALAHGSELPGRAEGSCLRASTIA